MYKKLFIIATLLLFWSCSHKGIVLIKEGQMPLSVTENISMLPMGINKFTLNSGDVLRLEASERVTGEKKFLLEKENQIRISFHYNTGNYMLMSGDIINVSFLADSSLSYELTIRVDGCITIPKIGELDAIEKTPEHLGKLISNKSKGMMNDPRVVVTVIRTNMDPINSISGEYRILPDGSIHLPILGTFQAAGISLENLENKITKAVQKKFINNFIASVIIQNFISRQLQAYERVITVTPSGSIILPDIGEIMVRGLTMSEMKLKIQEALGKKYSNEIDVAISYISGGSHSVYISGEVIAPGVYPIVPSMTMLKAVMLAGGANRTGNLEEAVLIHYTDDNELNIYKTNLEEVMEEGKINQDLKLSPQDIVFVPRSGIAKANLFIEQYVTNMLPFSRGVNYNYNRNPDLTQYE